MLFRSYEGLDLPWPRAYGRAMRRMYENMLIRVPVDGLLMPCEPHELLRAACPARGQWHVLGGICDFEYFGGLRANGEAAEIKKARHPEQAEFIDALLADLRGRFSFFGDSTHNCPDTPRILAEGFDAVERELADELAAVYADPDADEAERALLDALWDYAQGVRAFHRRAVEEIADAAAAAAEPRRAELLRLRDAFRDGFGQPATSFYQGFLVVHFMWMLDGCDNVGRLDQMLGALYDRDLASGAIDVAFARRLLDEHFVAIEQMNGYNLQVGGYTPAGEDGYNALSAEVLLACERNRLARPNVAFRITRHTPDEALRLALRALANGTGRPALYNDDLYMETLLGLPLGLSPEDARDLGFGGCTESMIPGRSSIGCSCYHSRHYPGIDINLAKILEYTLNDGYDPVERRQVGPHTGRLTDFASFDDLLSALRRQITAYVTVFFTDLSDDYRRRYHEGDPKLYRTLFTRDCVKRRRGFEAGGARYNWSITNVIGIANLADSLAALREAVFERGDVEATTLATALADNFAGHEPLRQRLLAAPKFGNDDPAVDELGRELLDFVCGEMLSQPHPRGGRYLPGCIMFNHWAGDGAFVGALPDGRLAGAVLADSAGPVQGRDTHGPTAMLRSVTKLPLARLAGTPVVNIRLQPEMLSTEAGLDTAVQLVRAYFALGGMQLQVNVVDTDTLRAAQGEPEAHRDLVVRVGGYSDYFTSLSAALQEAIIARTAHGM